jgi:hypothetical protein
MKIVLTALLLVKSLTVYYLLSENIMNVYVCTDIDTAPSCN